MVKYGVHQLELAWFKHSCANENNVVGLVMSIEKQRVKMLASAKAHLLASFFSGIYINDLSHAVQKSAASMYADDTSLCY